MKKMYIKPETDEVKVTAMGCLLGSFGYTEDMPGMPHPAPAHKVSTSGGVGVGLPDM